MRVNIDWLSEWVGPGLDAQGMAALLTTAGLEVDAVLPVAGDFDSVVVAKISGCKPHPNAERLRVCEVDDGSGVHTVVCGAANAREGLRTAFARPGAHLPGGRRIEAAKLRGVESAGMLCSSVELGMGEDSGGIIELPDDAPLGADLRSYLALDDQILDIDLTPNRGDCFSVTGIAREISAARGIVMSSPKVGPVAAMIEDSFDVRIDADRGCARFVGRIVKGIVSDSVSPTWLVERLRRAGLRSIHPVVDVTNYVMLELGQPLHGYDLRKLDSEIVVRWAAAGEALTLLDGRAIRLDDDVVVIADRSGAVGLAGIMGGASTAVDERTVDVFFEAAFFPPSAISGRARRYGLHTDASMRFERGVDPSQQLRAIERATELLTQIAGGRPGPVTEVTVSDGLPVAPSIHLRGERLAAVIGQTLPPQTIEESLELLGMQLTSDGTNAWYVVPPSFRFDLAIEEDLIEEVARLVGYDKIPAVAEYTVGRLGVSVEDCLDDDRIADLLVARGYHETISYSFIDADLATLINPGSPVERLANPISKDLGVMRRSLWPGLLTAAGKNLSRQQERLRLFEIGTQFEVGSGGTAETQTVAGLVCGVASAEHWCGDRRDFDFFDPKGDIEALVALTGRATGLRFVPDEHPALRPGRTARIVLEDEEIGWLGELHPAIQRHLDLKKVPVLFALKLAKIRIARLPAYRPFSKFPSLRRDLAVVVAEQVSAESVLRCVRAAAGATLENVNIFDVYRGQGVDSSRKSIGLGLILQDTYRTLTDEDADRTVAAVVERLGSELGATIRN